MNNFNTENISPDFLQSLPLAQFEGNIHVIDTKDKCRSACLSLKSEPTLGFDTETKPSFIKGEYHDTAMIQLSTIEDAYLFRLNMIGFPKQLRSLLEDPGIKKIGISIDDDLKHLNKIEKYTAKSFVDLNSTARELGVSHIGVKKLAAIFLGCRISKNQQTSNWETQVFSEAQKQYAATDAWICLEIFNKLRNQGYID